MAKKIGKRTLKATSIDKVDGKLQPQAIDLEKAVLGALMIDNESLSDTIDSLHPEYFYKREHQKIFEAIVKLFNNTQPVDILTVTEELKKMGEIDFVGGLSYISELTNNIASASNTEFHARIIAEKFIKRSLISISNNIINDAFNESVDIFDLLSNAEEKLFTVTEGTLRKSYDKMSVLIKGALENIEVLRNKEDTLSGIPTGFSNLDRITSGWQASDLIIIAARPGMGKTAFALSMARNIAIDHNTAVGFFSLEMSSEQLVSRLIASEAELGANKLRKGDLADHEMIQLHEKIKYLSEAPIFIDDTPALTIFELRAKARRLVKNHKVGILIIDYLQLMHAGGNAGNREQEISTISRSLKGIAKELKIPVIALSQVNRGVESRSGVGSKRPMLSDLRESGAIEQDADIVTFIYRPEYYKIFEWDNGDDSRGQAEIMIAKHRNGSLANIKLKFTAEFARFTNLDYIEGFEESEDQASMISMSSSMNEDQNDDPF